MAEKLVKQEGGRGPSGCGHREGCRNFCRDYGLHPLLCSPKTPCPSQRLPSPGHDGADGIIRCATVTAGVIGLLAIAIEVDFEH